MRDVKFVAIYGAGAAGAGAGSLAFILDAVGKRAAVFQHELAKAPELTDRVYKVADAAANNIPLSGLYLGVGLAFMAGGFLGISIYEACKNR